mmetsp:Transcript_85660/g.171469  ORF Transcript_85660/g.171469 Transcript_85660/m.171469 type:complete len:364 (-) Transcript_85660:409-1500(-)
MVADRSNDEVMRGALLLLLVAAVVDLVAVVVDVVVAALRPTPLPLPPPCLPCVLNLSRRRASLQPPPPPPPPPTSGGVGGLADGLEDEDATLAAAAAPYVVLPGVAPLDASGTFDLSYDEAASHRHDGGADGDDGDGGTCVLGPSELLPHLTPTAAASSGDHEFEHEEARAAGAAWGAQGKKVQEARRAYRSTAAPELLNTVEGSGSEGGGHGKHGGGVDNMVDPHGLPAYSAGTDMFQWAALAFWAFTGKEWGAATAASASAAAARTPSNGLPEPAEKTRQNAQVVCFLALAIAAILVFQVVFNRRGGFVLLSAQVSDHDVAWVQVPVKHVVEQDHLHDRLQADAAERFFRVLRHGRVFNEL